MRCGIASITWSGCQSSGTAYWTGRLAGRCTIVCGFFLGQNTCECVELSVQLDHVDLIAMVPPKKSISDMMGILKGRSAIRVFKQFPYLKRKPYWGNHFWAPGYCVDTVGLNEEMIRKYVKFQETKERHEEQLKLQY